MKPPLVVAASDPGGPPFGPPGGDTELLEKTTEKVTPPPMYRVILVNDDFTPREFVVSILMSVFRKNGDEARRIMITAHQGGRALVGVYTYDVANSRVERVTREAVQAGYPLVVYTEEV